MDLTFAEYVNLLARVASSTEVEVVRNASDRMINFQLGGQNYHLGPGEYEALPTALFLVAVRRGLPLASVSPPKPEPMPEPTAQAEEPAATPEPKATPKASKRRKRKDNANRKG